MSGEFKTFKRVDLKAFDDGPRDLILEMMAAGWVGRISTKGHAILRAPGGSATASIGAGSMNRALQNARADFERWRARQEPVEGSSLFSCSYCTFQASPETRVRDHEREKHWCDRCQTYFVQLDRHRSKVHPMEALYQGPPEDADNRPECITCGRRFESNRGLSAHQRSHELETQKCPECGKAVKYIDSHREKVHGITPKTSALESLLELLTEHDSMKQDLAEYKRLYGPLPPIR